MSEPQQPYGPPPGGQPAYGPPPGQPGGYGAAPTGAAPAAWGAGAPYQQPPYQGPQETEAKAVVALVLGVLAWTPVVPFIGAIAALVLARYAERDIDRAAGAKTGRGMVKAARILGWTHLVFCAVLFTLLLLFLVLGAGLSLVP